MGPRSGLLALASSASALAIAASLASGGAEARVEAESEYSKAQTYSGALRYLRVDLGYEVVERDPEAAYLIFRYTLPGPNKRSTNGTIEVVETRSRVKLLVQIAEMPEYHERILRDGLLKKLRVEYGAPPPRKAERPEGKRPVDAGAD